MVPRANDSRGGSAGAGVRPWPTLALCTSAERWAPGRIRGPRGLQCQPRLLVDNLLEQVVEVHVQDSRKIIEHVEVDAPLV